MSVLFVINVFEDAHLAERLVRQIDQHYPDAARLTIPDEPRLKNRQTGEWTHRYLEYALGCESDVIVKLDPDTCIWRRTTIPTADWFGTLTDGGNFIRGGACGFSRSAAEKLVSSGLLLNQGYYNYPRYDDFRWPHEERSLALMPLQDGIVGDAMDQLGIKPTPWPDVCIWGNRTENRIPEPAGWAMTHPHPFL